MNGLPRGFAAAQRAYENASPPDDDDGYDERVREDDERMAACREAAFDTEDAIALATLLANCPGLIQQLAWGRKVTDLEQHHQDKFAELAREVKRLEDNLDEKVADEAQRWRDNDQAEADEARAEAAMAAQEDARLYA